MGRGEQHLRMITLRVHTIPSFWLQKLAIGSNSICFLRQITVSELLKFKKLKDIPWRHKRAEYQQLSPGTKSHLGAPRPQFDNVCYCHSLDISGV
ncbi:hypothetical protein TNCV_2622931 [Trichonephila clavipes]|nr:hypothetical protein TNCV_2622931 [Trichonephila clavipes]